MPYKCEYNDKNTCENCSHYFQDWDICRGCDNAVYIKCPSSRGLSYPEREHICESCKFEPKESEESNMIMNEKEMDEQIEKYMEQELKPCKCGGEANFVQVYIGASENLYYEVKCKKCGHTTATCGSVKKAIEEWNNNVADLKSKKKEEPLEPCVCGVMPHLESQIVHAEDEYFYQCPACGNTTIGCETEAEAKAYWNYGVKAAKKKIQGTNCAVKDSGERRQFETGAVEIEIDLTKVKNAKKIRIVVAD